MIRQDASQGLRDTIRAEMRGIDWLAVAVNPNGDGPMTRANDHLPMRIRRAAR
ncbi:MAG: hypothetical protein AAFV87_07010 [Pseudomonadota bacterium]